MPGFPSQAHSQFQEARARRERLQAELAAIDTHAENLQHVKDQVENGERSEPVASPPVDETPQNTEPQKSDLPRESKGQSLETLPATEEEIALSTGSRGEKVQETVDKDTVSGDKEGAEPRPVATPARHQTRKPVEDGWGQGLSPAPGVTSPTSLEYSPVDTDPYAVVISDTENETTPQGDKDILK